MSPLEGARTAPAPTYFSTIQVLRGVAALLVVLYHLVDAELVYGLGPRLLDGVARLGFAGVDVFFVISGFVMTTIAAGRYGSPANAGQFLLRRAIRILPLYWIYTSAIVALLLFVPQALNAGYHDKSIAASYLLWPQPDLPLLQVGWTLTYEALFYLMVAFAIATLSERRVGGFLGIWAIALVPLQFVTMPTPWQTVLASPMAWEFIAGALLGIHWQRLPVRFATPCLAVGVAGFLVGATVLSRLELHEQDALRRTLVFGASAALVVLGLVARENAGATAPHRWLRQVGDASYSIYLSHLFVVTATARLWGRSGWNDSAAGHVLFIVATLAACILFGLLSFRLLERPLFSLLDEALRRRPARAMVAPQNLQ